MTDPGEPKDVEQDPAVRNYVFLCLTALVVLFLVLVRRGLAGWSFLPVLVGVLGVGLRWRLAPVLCLILLTGLLYAVAPAGEGMRYFHGLPKTFRLEDWILSGAVLAYFVAHYRLQGLTISVFPLDPRRLESEGTLERLAPLPLPAGKQQQRDSRLVSPSEIGWLIVSLPIWAFLAQFCWILLPRNPPAFADLDPRQWQGIATAWILGLGLWLAASLLDYAGRRRMTPREATLVLQDVLWRESSRDQRRLNRWLAWAWFRRRRRKEKL